MTSNEAFVIIFIWASTREKTYLRGFANNKGPDQSAYPRRLIGAFIIRFSLSIVSKLAAGEISII